MPITRHQAQALLNAGEMELYDESRSNPLRKLDAAALEKRIARARRARDRARDLTQRQKLASRAATEKSNPFAAPIVTPVEKASEFYPAESYHQDYYIKNPLRYKYDRTSCGRDARLQQLWGDLAGR